MIRMNRVNKWFGDFQVLKNVNLHVKPGEVVVVLGPSGSGKSTLLRVINGLEPIQEGEIFCDGCEINHDKKKLTKLRAEIGMVFQQFNLYPHLTALENITLAPLKVRKINKKEAVDKANMLLDKVGLYGKSNHYPCQLSGGEQQRVAIARSLAMEPKMMLFDEPTSALDPELINEVLDVMTSLALEGMTMLVVTHEMGFARRVADRQVFVDKGEIIESGHPQELLLNPRNERTKQFMSKILHERSTLHFVRKTGKIRIGVGCTTPPLNFIDDNGHLMGFDIDLASELAQRLGCIPEFIRVTNKERINYIVSNKVDMCISKLNHTKTRERLIDFSYSYIENRKRILAKKGRFKTMESLANIKISVAEGTSTARELIDCFQKKELGEPVFVEYNSEKEAFTALETNIVDGYASDEIIILSYLGTGGGNHPYEMVNDPCCYSYFCVGVPENDSEWLNDINIQLQEIYQEGIYKKLFYKWFGEDMFPYMKNIEKWAE